MVWICCVLLGMWEVTKPLLFPYLSLPVISYFSLKPGQDKQSANHILVLQAFMDSGDHLPPFDPFFSLSPLSQRKPASSHSAFLFFRPFRVTIWLTTLGQLFKYPEQLFEFIPVVSVLWRWVGSFVGTLWAYRSRRWQHYQFSWIGTTQGSGRSSKKRFKMAIFGITTRYVWFVVPLSGFFFGKFLDDQETLRMTSFRDKSALFGGKVKEGDPPSWP